MCSVTRTGSDCPGQRDRARRAGTGRGGRAVPVRREQPPEPGEALSARARAVKPGAERQVGRLPPRAASAPMGRWEVRFPLGTPSCSWHRTRRRRRSETTRPGRRGRRERRGRRGRAWRRWGRAWGLVGQEARPRSLAVPTLPVQPAAPQASAGRRVGTNARGDSGQCTVRGGVAAAGLPTPRRGLVPHGEAGSGAPRRHAHTLGPSARRTLPEDGPCGDRGRASTQRDAWESARPRPGSRQARRARVTA